MVGLLPRVARVGAFWTGSRHGRGELPPASGQRVNAPAAPAGPGCESRGVAPVGRAAGAPRRAEGAGRRLADRPRLPRPAGAARLPPRAPGFPTRGQQVVPAALRRARLRRAGSGRDSPGVARGGGPSAD